MESKNVEKKHMAEQATSENLNNRKAYNVNQVAKMLGIGRNEAYRMVRDGVIPSFRISPRRIIVPASALDAWLEQSSTQSLPV